MFCGLFGTSGRATLKSPTPQLLKSNTPPSENEKWRIREAIINAQEVLSSIQTRKEGSGDETATTEASAKHPPVLDIHTFIDAHQHLLSVFRSFPPELISLIFIFCLPTMEWVSYDWIQLPSFSLSRVCRKWRAIALDTPRIWSTFTRVSLTPATTSINPSAGMKRSRRYISFVEEMLRRSKDEDIYLYVDSPIQPHSRRVQPLIDILTRHAHRWGGFVIHSNYATFLAFCEAQRDLQTGTGPPFPRLQKLGLHLTQCPMNFKIQNFANTPVVHELSISGFDPCNIDIPHRHLQVYREHFWDEWGTRTTLGHVLATSTKTLKRLDVLLASPNLAFGPKKVTLSALEQLHVRVEGYHLAIIQELLDDLVLPVLEDLSVAQHHAPAFDAIYSLIRRSCGNHIHLHSLKKMQLYVDLESGDLKTLLAHTPSLEELDVPFPPFLDLFTLLAGEISQHPDSPGTSTAPRQLVPKLKKLTISSSVENIVGDESTLNAVAKARSQCRRPARQCTFHQPHHQERQNLQLFYLKFKCPDDAYTALGLLNKWRIIPPPQKSGSFSSLSSSSPRSWDVANDKGITAQALLLVTWRLSLHKLIPILDIPFMIRWARKPKVSAGFSERFHAIIETIEKFVPDSVADIYVSKLHFSLSNLTGHRYIPGDKKFHFRTRVEAILKKWHTLFLQDIRSPGTASLWAVEDSLTVCFIPADDPLRAEADALKSIVYSFKS